MFLNDSIKKLVIEINYLGYDIKIFNWYFFVCD